ncbi:uncharacterized protein LOC143850996 [Tasmannia lanceolata]|uniref:uncharacterized protein LOC143850996 n=1 Tax=Tasmannia lanceolata TaxID=3420 RepID=UPI004062E0CB
MGRAPCCDKANVKKGPWSPEEDATLKGYIEEHGTGGNWITLPQKIGLKRCGKSCRLRWLNYLRPNIKHGGFSEEEDNIICCLYVSIGSRWSIIAAQLPGRTDNDIKNYWNTRLKKKLFGKQRKEQQARRACGVKQEINKGDGEFMVAGYGNQNPCWPQPPIPISVQHPNEEPRLNDLNSIRKLLIKLGGRFSNNPQEPNDDGLNLQFPIDISTTQNLYEHSSNSITASASINSFTENCSSFLVNQYKGFPVKLDEAAYCETQRLQGLDCFYGLVRASESSGSISAETISWDDMSSLVYPPLVSNYEAFQQGMFQECILEESRYLGLR